MADSGPLAPGARGSAQAADDGRIYIDHCPLAVLVADRRGRYVDWNRAALELLRVDDAVMGTLTVLDLIREDDRAAAAEHFASVAESGVADGEFRIRRGDGTVGWTSVRAVRIDDERLVAFCQDTTERRNAEQVLRESEAKYRAAIETAGEGFLVVDLAGRILEVNDAYAARSGYSRDELLNMSIADVEANESAEAVREHIARVVHDGHALFESQHRSKDGSTWQLEVSCSYWPIASGRLFVFVRDLAHRTITESLLKTRLRLSEAADRLTLDELIQVALDDAELYTGSSIAFFHFVDPDQQNLTLQTWSTNTLHRMCTAEGKGQHYPISKAGIWTDCVHVREAVIHNDYRAVPHRKGMPDGHAHVERLLSVPIIRGGLVTAIIGVGNKPTDYDQTDIATVEQLASVAIDIIARKKAETRLRESELRYRTLVETASEGVWVVDGQYRTTFVNPAMCEMLGYTGEEFAGRPVEAFLFESDIPEHEARVRERHRGESSRYEKRFRRRDGTECWCLVAATPVLDAGGALTGSFGMFSDITARKRRERRLAASEAISAILAESDTVRIAIPQVLGRLAEEQGWSFGVLWRWDDRFGCLRCAGTWHDPRLSADELVAACRASSFVPGDDLPGRVRSGGAPLFVARLADEPGFGRAALAERFGLESALAVPLADGRNVSGVIEFLGPAAAAPDAESLEWLVALSSRFGDYLERRWVEEQIHRFVSIGPALIYVLVEENDGFRCTWVSDNVEALTGYPPGEIGDEWWRAGLHPDDRERVEAAHPRPYAIEHQILEFRFRRRDGTYIWVRDEKRLGRRGDGGPTEIIGSWSDVTERVLLEEQLRQSQKLDAIGRLAGGVAHDFNNLLTVINGYSDLLLTSLPPGDPMSAHLADIRTAGERASDLTRQLLSFGRKQHVEPRVLDLNAVVASHEKLLRRLIGENIELTAEFDPAAAPVRIDPGQVQQVLTNLVVNARDAMRHGGALRIATGAVEWTADDCRLHAARRPGRFTTLTVTDTGTGMTEATRSRIFEPFFTTKGPGEGTGLGLSTVFGIVAQADGLIEVESEVGRGTSVCVCLPAVTAPLTEPERDAANDEPAANGHETILLVEDEHVVRGVARAALEANGYVVLEAYDGPSALEVFDRHHDRIDLLVTDVVMPRMNGDELAAELRRRAPALRVLFVSGYTQHPLELTAGGARSSLLQKPFRPAVLASRVRELLDDR